MAVKWKLALLLRSNSHGYMGVHPYVLEWPLLTTGECLRIVVYLERIFVAQRILLQRVGAEACEIAEGQAGLQKEKVKHFLI